MISKDEAQKATREYIEQMLTQAWAEDASACVIVVVNRDTRGYVQDIVAADRLGKASPKICFGYFGPEGPEATSRLATMALFHGAMLHVKPEQRGTDLLMAGVRTWCRDLAKEFRRRLR